MPSSRPVKRCDAEVVGTLAAQRWLDCHGQQARTWLNQIRRARCAAADLAGTLRGSPITCHGDLSIKNVLLSDDRGPLAIDPNPCAGHPAYDAAQWAVTQIPVAEAPQRAAAVAAALGIHADEVQRWVCVLVAVEVCLASLPRAQASLELARRLSSKWLC